MVGTGGSEAQPPIRTMLRGSRTALLCVLDVHEIPRGLERGRDRSVLHIMVRPWVEALLEVAERVKVTVQALLWAGQGRSPAT